MVYIFEIPWNKIDINFDKYATILTNVIDIGLNNYNCNMFYQQI